MSKLLSLFIAVMLFFQPAMAAQTADEVLSNSISHSQLAPMPAEWFTCKTSSDCELVDYNCSGGGYAVNIKHVDDTEKVFCALPHPCVYDCFKSSQPNSKAVCEAGRCVMEPINSP